ncbi:MAG: hypothetical protein AB7P49_18375 [Bdellovibrionales bacterium]
MNQNVEVSSKELGMAEEQVGLRKEDLRDWAPWTKIFTAFKVALDPKKLILAGGGILLMALGWWLLAIIFFAPRSTPPQWHKYSTNDAYKDDQDAAWKAFKQDLKSWNLIYKLAGDVPSSPEKAIPFGPEDYANNLEQYVKLKDEIQTIRNDINRKDRKLDVTIEEVDGLGGKDKVKKFFFTIDNRIEVPFSTNVGDAIVQEKLDKQLTAQALLTKAQPEKEVQLAGIPVTVGVGADGKSAWERFQVYLNTPRTLTDIQNELLESPKSAEQKYITRLALQIIKQQQENKFKPAGWLRTWPWFEYRGPNPFMMITGMRAGTKTSERKLPWERGEFFSWFVSDQIPVLLEPLFKFLTPVVYLFHPDAGFWTRFYLLMVILVTMGTWSLFGGAISRMAVVQVARQNEKVGLRDALKFSWARYRSYTLAQVAPLIALAFLALLLIIYGFLEILVPIIGDILIAGIGLPLALILGLVMAVVLVGLIGWPLMYATISTEGTDAFDGISRAYSYVYQAPWNYLWYCFIAIIYGAALIFFVSLMGSLTVYMTKWGMSLGTVWREREPSYLFVYAPTSYEWRDLLLYQSPEVQTMEVVRPNGTLEQTYGLNETYMGTFGIHNYIGAYLVALWIYLLFLMVIGFGYSYFWTASSIIYLLMRRKVDDTDLDEVHLEEEDIDIPYSPPPAMGTPTPPPSSGGGMPLTMVEAPTMRSPSPAPSPSTPTTPGYTAPTTDDPSGAIPATPATPGTPLPSSSSEVEPQQESSPTNSTDGQEETEEPKKEDKDTGSSS